MRIAAKRYFAVLATLSLLWGGNAARAEFQGQSVSDVVAVSFLSGWRLADGNHMAAIRIDLAPGWKTYWRAPGEGGVPTLIHLDETRDVRDVVIHWPRPDVFVVNGMRSIGYKDSVVLPLEFALDAPGEIAIAGRVDMGVCLDVCIPITLNLSGGLPTGTQRDAAIVAALTDRPLTAAEAGAGTARCQLTPISDGLRVSVSIALPETGALETVVIEHRDPGMWVSETVTRREGTTVSATADIVPPHHGAFALNRRDLRFSVIGSRMAVELDGCQG
ncbi:protein-disulfide reductase DsbD domain-containing protein [Roseicyclus sp.]|uniref:protein-disulfide reductase DsbD domain-containing protein n=1 Tax=Roseicyclus sp. TaxID=1914329 RepID=UPI003F6C3C3A